MDQAASAIPFSRILVTGANGFVGGHLLPTLTAKLAPDASIFLASRTPTGGGDHEQIACDLADPVSVSQAVERAHPDLLIHLAAQASVGQAQGTAADTWSVNLGGSLALAHAVALIVPGCTVLQISSAEVYGLTFNHEVATEASALRPQSAYARSKVAAEAMFTDVLPVTARLIIARPSNHSGPGQDERFVIPAFAAQIARIEAGLATEMLVGNLDAERDFLDVRDVVAAYLRLLIAAPGLPMRNVFNIASGHTLPIREVLTRLRAMSCVDTPALPDHERMRPSEVPRAVIANGAIRDATGWSPIHGLDDTLAMVLDEWRQRFGNPSDT